MSPADLIHAHLAAREATRAAHDAVREALAHARNVGNTSARLLLDDALDAIAAAEHAYDHRPTKEPAMPEPDLHRTFAVVINLDHPVVDADPVNAIGYMLAHIVKHLRADGLPPVGATIDLAYDGEVLGEAAVLDPEDTP